MTYLVSLISIILVLFLFIDEQELRKREYIFKSLTQDERKKYIRRKKYIKENLNIIESVTINNLPKEIFAKSEYILLHKEGTKISKKLEDKLIYNFIYRKEILCLYNGRYSFKTSEKAGRWEKIKLYIYSNLLNYINIFDKQSNDSYMAILGKCEDIENYSSKKKSISYLADGLIARINLEKKEEKKKVITMYIDCIKNLSIGTSLKVGIFLFSTGSVTLNLIRSAFNISSDIYPFILALSIYYCYTKILQHMYKSIGKIKYLATYLFPIYILIYIIVTINIGIHSLKKT